MNFKDIDENVNVALGSLLIWVNCVRDPLGTSESLIHAGLPDDRKMHQAMRIWSVATLIALVIQLPGFSFLHLDWKKIEVWLPAVMILLVTFLMIVAVIHVGLKIYGIPSAFPDTLALYSAIVGSYSPIITVLSLPGLVQVLAALRAAKSAGADDIGAVLGHVMRLISEQSLAMQIYQGIAGPILLVVSATLMIIFQRCISALYNSETFRTVSAISFSMGVLLPVPMILILGLYYFTFYVAL